MTQPLPGASLTRRLASLAYESLLVAALLLGATALFTPLFAWLGHAPLLDALLQLWLAVVLFGYFGWCWVKGGQTVAMKTWRVRLVDHAGLTLDWRGAARRFLIGLVLYVGLPALSYLGLARNPGTVPHHVTLAFAWWLLPLLSAWLDPEKLFLHDRLAGTRLVAVPRTAKR